MTAPTPDRADARPLPVDGDVRLGVQVVVFQNPLAQLERLAGAIAAAVRALRNEMGLARVEVRWGDCSPSPVFDDSSEDAIRRALDGTADEVSFTFFDANLGSAGGSNALAAERDDDLIWILNPDTYPAPNSALELVRAVSQPGVAIGEGRQIPVEHPKWYDPATGDTSWVAAACLMVRRTAFDEVGGFDDRFFPLYCDDVDLSWRLRFAGWRVVHVPRAVVFHDKRPDTDGGVRWSPTEARSNALARLWLYRRYGRPDLEAELLDGFDRSGDATLVGVAAEFRARVAAGDAPVPLHGAESVAQFVDGQYAPRRFAYRA
jgi:GT2 family glycosyltransferase